MGMFDGCTELRTLPKLKALALKSSCYSSMFAGCTKIKVSTEQDAEYSVPFRIPAEGTGTGNASMTFKMFDGTGGPFTGAPSPNVTYYLATPAA